jgi:hypothetical protein
MALRFCPACAGEVDSVDGFCRLGHSVKLSAPVQSLADFRAEEKDSRVAPANAAASQGPPPPPEEAEPVVGEGRFGRLWRAQGGGGVLDNSDPITAFAPYPRMDWGPDRLHGFRRRLTRGSEA